MSQYLELNINPNDRKLLREFVRGQNFNIIMHLPKYIIPSFFRFYTPTAQLRRLNNPTDEGFIANLKVTWLNDYTSLWIRYEGDTSEWPLGPAEFDVVLTSSTTSDKIRTYPVRFTIVPGVTR